MLKQLNSDNQYGILLSGGLDSAVLLSILIQENPGIKIQPFTIPKSDGASLYANPVVHYINNKFDKTIPDTILVGDPTVHHRQQSSTAVKDIFNNYKIDYLYIGITQNPPELNNLDGAPLRDKKSTHPQILFPFVEMYKTDVLNLMYEYHFEDLIDITHTCTEQQQGRCNRCWQCTERVWAFKQLDKTDTGTR